MRSDIDTSDIGNELLISIFLFFYDEAIFPFLQCIPEVFRCIENTKLKWHVESGKSRPRVEFDSRQVVNSVSAFLDDPHNHIQSKLHSIVDFTRTTRHETGVKNNECTRTKHVQILAIERAVNEDLIVIAIALHASRTHV